MRGGKTSMKTTDSEWYDKDYSKEFNYLTTWNRKIIKTFDKHWLSKTKFSSNISN